MVFFFKSFYATLNMDVKLMTIELNNQEVEVVIIKKNNKNIYFRFKDDLKLYVTCHHLCSSRQIKKLIDDNIEAISKMHRKALEKNLKEQDFWYLGNSYTVIYDNSVKEVYFDNDFIYTKDDKMLNKFYKNEVIRIFTNEVNRCVENFLKVPKFSLKFRRMSTRWGVCNRGNNTITLNTELLKKKIHLLDYVIIHELSHFYHANHGEKFWELVGEYYPNYKQARKELRD